MRDRTQGEFDFFDLPFFPSLTNAKHLSNLSTLADPQDDVHNVLAILVSGFDFDFFHTSTSFL
jgi:hypothetical protein